MRITPLSAGAAAMCLLLAAPAFAQEAGDCDMLCRLKGYLSTDHMAGDAAGDGPAATPAKARHPRAASIPKPTPPASRPVATAVAHKPAIEARAVAKAPPIRPAPGLAHTAVATALPGRPAKPVPAKVAAPAPAEATTTLPARRAALHPIPASPKAATAMADAAPARVATPRHLMRQRPAPASATTRTASLATPIPGSSPPMQAGFH